MRIVAYKLRDLEKFLLDFSFLHYYYIKTIQTVNKSNIQLSITKLEVVLSIIILMNSENDKQLSKHQFALQFVDKLIMLPEFKPFLHFDDVSFGFLDVVFITKQRGRSLQKIREDLKARKKYSHDWLLLQLKKVFRQVSEYVLLTDPLQHVCKEGLKLIKYFQKDFESYFKKDQPQRRFQTSKMKTTNFKNQLEMACYLRNYENDEETLKQIGELCQIVEETDEQYIFNLGSSNLWLDIIQKSSNH